jgi:hypothetical protein
MFRHHSTVRELRLGNADLVWSLVAEADLLDAIVERFPPIGLLKLEQRLGAAAIKFGAAGWCASDAESVGCDRDQFRRCLEGCCLAQGVGGEFELGCRRLAAEMQDRAAVDFAVHQAEADAAQGGTEFAHGRRPGDMVIGDVDTATALA